MEKKLIFILVFSLGILFQSAAGLASPARDVRQGNALYEKGDYDASLKEYQEALDKDPESDVINFDAGTAYYKKEEYKKSIEHLQKALLSEDEGLRQNAYYNLGNALYQLATQATNIEDALSSLEQSLMQYESAMNLDDKDHDARYNHEFVKKELKRLKEKQEQQQKTCPDSQKAEDGGQKEEDGEQKAEDGEQKEEDGGQKAEDGEQKPEDGEQQALTKQEAKMFLDNYQQNEEPKGLLNFMKRKGKELPVLKDW
ncbi:MAG: tetratricopeptide repeat protein [Candidatus Omnitrophica bacterium]|nr:tetratricopeptide repeat protein [Candidatus Omnitrophota bacterium]